MVVRVSIILVVTALAVCGTDAANIISGIKDDCLNAHNAVRRLHQNTPDMQWDYQLQRDAEAWARKQADGDSLDHKYNIKQGENLYSGYKSCPRSCAEAVLSWYGEIKDYNFNSPGFSSSTGHFTQVVWKASIRLGVGIATVQKGRYLRTVIVGRYEPRGNFGYRKDYRINVLPKKPGAITPSLKTLDPNGGKCNSGSGKSGGNSNRGGSRNRGGSTNRGGGSNRGGTITRTRKISVVVRGVGNQCKDATTQCPTLVSVFKVCSTSNAELLCKKSCNKC